MLVGWAFKENKAKLWLPQLVRSLKFNVNGAGRGKPSAIGIGDTSKCADRLFVFSGPIGV